MDFLEAANRWAESNGFPSSLRVIDSTSSISLNQTARAVSAATAAAASASAAAAVASARLITSPQQQLQQRIHLPPTRAGASSPALTLAEAAERTATAEARADALQAALDRYSVEGEALEVREY